MTENEKQLSENILLDVLRQDDCFPPLQVKLIETNKRSPQADRIVGGLVEVDWNESRFVFAVGRSLQFNPKALREAAERVKRLAAQLDVYPLLLAPYLADDQLRILETEQVSGIDLCGNGVIVVPEQLLVFRTGMPNKYPASSPIRNIYRGASSSVTRCFLLRREYESSQDLLEEIATRGSKVTLPTVSKVCSSLADDLIIDRQRQGRTTRLQLLQPEKLLSRLAENYEPPEIRRKFTGKVTLDESTFAEVLATWQNETSEQVVRTGASSSERYATMAREPIDRYYCTNLSSLLEQLGDSVRETQRFPNLQLFETDDATVYFDRRAPLDASPVQTYLELAQGDKRERETAEQLREQLLRKRDRSKS